MSIIVYFVLFFFPCLPEQQGKPTAVTGTVAQHTEEDVFGLPPEYVSVRLIELLEETLLPRFQLSPRAIWVISLSLIWRVAWLSDTCFFAALSFFLFCIHDFFFFKGAWEIFYLLAFYNTLSPKLLFTVSKNMYFVFFSACTQLSYMNLGQHK